MRAREGEGLLMTKTDWNCGQSSHLVALSGVSKTIKGRCVLRDVSLVIDKGRIIGVRGPNGSGKTMLLRAIAGLIGVDTGAVEFEGRIISDDRSFPDSIGFLIEPIELWSELSGFGNLALLARIRNRIGRPEIERALIAVGLSPEDGRSYGKYSLGMRQRLCIAQAIMEKPDLILLDEPTNALDEEGKGLIDALLLRERERGASILLVSHDHDELDRLSDVQYSMADGRLEAL